MNGEYTHQQKTALFTGAFLDELCAQGVREVVVSPGSRSTPLAMCAYEMSRRRPDRLRIYVDVDERGAAFFALGLAKAGGRPVALVCTSGTAVANYLPAVVEASTARVPLVVLTGDRPLRLQGVGAPQTCDQLKIFGGYVRRFQEMPEPAATPQGIAFVRQMAREAVLAAMGPGANLPNDEGFYGFAGTVVASRGCAHLAGPVHLNFPFDEPLKPDFCVEGAFEMGRRSLTDGPQRAIVGTSAALSGVQLAALRDLLAGGRVLVLAGEGTCETAEEARTVIAWAASLSLPLLADPLSGLRSFAAPCVIDNYDNVMRAEDAPLPDVVIRFGRWPISKPACTRLAAADVATVVVDAAETRDFNSMTDLFVACTPLDFVRQDWLGGEGGNEERGGECGEVSGEENSEGGCEASAAKRREAGPAERAASSTPHENHPTAQQRFFDEWVARNDAERSRICAVTSAADAHALEGAYVRTLLELIPAGSLLFSASSMPIRALDTFMVKGDKPLAVLCNRAQNGIDGTTSTALGAAQRFSHTTFLTGDFTLLHDLSALALRRELEMHHGVQAGEPERNVVIVLLNNDGGAIFDMLPQRSDDDYFERLFLVPQGVRFEHAAAAFSIPYAHVSAVSDFAEAYEAALARPGINLIEISVPLRGVPERYAPYQS